MSDSSTLATGSTKTKATGGAASHRADAFTVSIPKGMAGQAAQAAKTLGITKAQLVKTALAEMLEEMQDIADAKRIMADIESGKTKTIPWEEVKRRNGL